jgi:hypothetical protein
MTVTVRPARENHQLFSGLWKFEQGQDQHDPLIVAKARSHDVLNAFVIHAPPTAGEG